MERAELRKIQKGVRRRELAVERAQADLAQARLALTLTTERYLAGSTGAILGKHSIGILEFAEQEGIDPRWFYAELVSYTTSLISTSHEPNPHTPPIESLTRSQDAFNAARDAMAVQPTFQSFSIYVASALERAHMLAVQEEQEDPAYNAQRPINKIYGWMHTHVRDLYELRRPQFVH